MRLGMMGIDPTLTVDYQVLEGTEDSVPAGVDGLTESLGALICDLGRRVESVCTVEHVPHHKAFVEEDICLHYLILLDSELDCG